MDITELKDKAFQEFLDGLTESQLLGLGVTTDTVKGIFTAGWLSGRVNGLETAIAIQKGA